MLTRKQQAQLRQKVLRYHALHAQHLRLEKEDEALHTSILDDLEPLTRLELSMDDGGLLIITITTQQRRRVNPTLLLANYPTVYDDVLSVSAARTLHIELSASEIRS